MGGLSRARCGFLHPLRGRRRGDRARREPTTAARPGPVGPNGPNGLREVLWSLPALARVGWFALGALVATSATLVVVMRPWARGVREPERRLPYEGFPFADNAGVCQEYVALATLRTSHADAQAIAGRLATSVPAER